MSIECGYCERDLRGGHDLDCPRVNKGKTVWFSVSINPVHVGEYEYARKGDPGSYELPIIKMKWDGDCWDWTRPWPFKFRPAIGDQWRGLIAQSSREHK